MRLRHDDDIHELEARVRSERAFLVKRVDDMGRAARAAVASPRGLLFALAAGYLIGEIVRSRGHPRGHAPSAAPVVRQRARSAGRSGLLGAAVLALVRAQFGSPLGLVRAVIDHLSARRRRTFGTPIELRTETEDAALDEGPARWP